MNSPTFQGVVERASCPFASRLETQCHKNTRAKFHSWAVLGFVWLVWGGSTLWATEKDTWAVELDAGGVAALGSSVVRSEGKSGFSAGGLVRYGGNTGWSRGMGYNVLSLKNGYRLKPVTIVGDRHSAHWGAWSPYVRLGAGIGTDKKAGSMNRLVFRSGVGVSRAIHPHWDVGLKSELWYSPPSGLTGESMTLLTAGITLARSFKTIPRKDPPAKPVEQKQATTQVQKFLPLPLAGEGRGEGGVSRRGTDQRPEQSQKQAKPAEEMNPSDNDSPPATASDGLPAGVTAPATETTETAADPAVGVTSHKITLLFQFDRSDSDGSDLATKIPALEEIANILRHDPAAQAEIHGHADSNGPLGYNIALSRKRAQTVRDFFVTRWGLDKNRFTLFAHGAKNPAASNTTPHGRAKNRRVLVLLIP